MTSITPHYAVLERPTEIVRLLMQSGADARTGIYPRRQASTALTIAAERGYDEIVAIIREEEASRRAALSGRVPLVKLLLERRADPLEADAEPWAMRERGPGR